MGSFLSGMVDVAYHANIKVLAQGLGHVRRDSLFGIAIELCPVVPTLKKRPCQWSGRLGQTQVTCYVFALSNP